MPAARDLLVALSGTDRTWSILTGRVTVPGYRITAYEAPVEEIFERQSVAVPFDVSEMSLASYVMARARGDDRLTAIPVFLSRSFRHSALYVRTDSPLTTLEQLAGCRLGLPEYQMTAAVWVRALMRDAGVPSETVTWLTYRPERLPVETPARRGRSANLYDALRDAEVEAIMSARRPPSAAFRPGEEGTIRRLLPTVWQDERQYHERTGTFPIMHLVSVRRELVERDPELPRLLQAAFQAAMVDAVERLHETVVLAAAVPWLTEAVEASDERHQGEVWPYGIQANLASLQAFIGYLVEDGLIEDPIEVARLFDESVRQT